MNPVINIFNSLNESSELRKKILQSLQTKIKLKPNNDNVIDTSEIINSLNSKEHVLNSILLSLTKISETNEFESELLDLLSSLKQEIRSYNNKLEDIVIELKKFNSSVSETLYEASSSLSSKNENKVSLLMSLFIYEKFLNSLNDLNIGDSFMDFSNYRSKIKKCLLSILEFLRTKYSSELFKFISSRNINLNNIKQYLQ